jgi:hypothetical protein
MDFFVKRFGGAGHKYRERFSMTGYPERLCRFTLALLMAPLLWTGRAEAQSTAVLPLAITTPSPLPEGTVNVGYSAKLAATGGIPPYVWRFTTLPAPGLDTTTSGAIPGTPSTPGAFTFSVQVNDQSQQTATQKFFVSVVANPVTFVTTSSLPEAIKERCIHWGSQRPAVSPRMDFRLQMGRCRQV